MSSVDRLREAAEVLDRYDPDATAVTIDGHWATDREVIFYRSVARQFRAAGTLLRTVAHEWESFAERMGSALSEDYDDATLDAALALAATILGTVDD